MDSKAGNVGVTRGDLKTIFEHYRTVGNFGKGQIEPALIEAVSIFADAGWHEEISSVLEGGLREIRSAKLLHAFAGALKDAETLPSSFDSEFRFNGKSEKPRQGIDPKDWMKAAELLSISRKRRLAEAYAKEIGVSKEDRRMYLELKRQGREPLTPLPQMTLGRIGRLESDGECKLILRFLRSREIGDIEPKMLIKAVEAIRNLNGMDRDGESLDLRFLSDFIATLRSGGAKYIMGEDITEKELDRCADVLCSVMWKVLRRSERREQPGSKMKPSGRFLERMRGKLGVMKRKMGLPRQTHTK